MPELPEVEVLVRHLNPLVKGRRIKNVEVRREKVILPGTVLDMQTRLTGARFSGVERRGKFLVFQMQAAGRAGSFRLVGHLGMTGRMYLQSSTAKTPKHAAVVINLGRESLIYEDPRYFGRFTLDDSSLARLGPEPFSDEFTVDSFAAALKRSGMPVKVRLLDQSVLAGVGNIYASESCHVAGISPKRLSRRLKRDEVERLHQAIRAVLAEAIEFGSTVPLNWSGTGKKDGLFYYGRAAGEPDYYEERLRVYDRKGKPCGRCGTAIRRIEQVTRSTYFCPGCQK